MFDSIKVEYELPGLPPELTRQWGSMEGIIFQTKDTPHQALYLYKIDSKGNLFYKEARKSPKQPTVGWVEALTFSGDINFYNPYNHKDYDYTYNIVTSQESSLYEEGWVEYRATFKAGLLVEITQTENTIPRKLTAEEADLKDREWKKRYKQNYTKV